MTNILVIGETVGGEFFAAKPRTAFMVYKTDRTLLVSETGTVHLKIDPGLYPQLRTHYMRDPDYLQATHPDRPFPSDAGRLQRNELLYLDPVKQALSRNQ